MTSFSIVTVVYNDITHIQETINSVVNQSYRNIEYILIDGGSNDGTKETILDYIHSCANITREENKKNRYYLEATHSDHSALTFKFLSEKDKGIYDAMNKGITLATKEWINFMNCGDKFSNPNVLEEIDKHNIDNYDVVYGDVEIVTPNSLQAKLLKMPSPQNIPYMFRGFCHQGFFIKTSIHQDFPFDLKYKIASDYNSLYLIYLNKYSFLRINIPIAKYLSGGLSDNVGLECTKEVFQIAITHTNIIGKKLILTFYCLPFAILRRLVKKFINSLFCTQIIK